MHDGTAAAWALAEAVADGLADGLTGRLADGLLLELSAAGTGCQERRPGAGSPQGEDRAPAEHAADRRVVVLWLDIHRQASVSNSWSSSVPWSATERTLNEFGFSIW